MQAFLYHINVLSQKARSKSQTTSICRIEKSLIDVFEQICNCIDENERSLLISNFIQHTDKFIETGVYSYEYKRANPLVPSDPVIETKITLHHLFNSQLPIESKLVSEIAA